MYPVYDLIRPAAEAIQKDDGVIMLWSFDYMIHQSLFNLLNENDGNVKLCWEFPAQHIRHPKSGDQILLVNAPDSDDGQKTAAKAGLNDILTRAEEIGVKYITHIWVHQLASGYIDHIEQPYGWKNFNNIFRGSVEMDRVTILTTNWEKVEPRAWNLEEERIRGALGDDINVGLVFERLLEFNAPEAWKVIDRVIEDASIWPKEKTQYKKAERGRMRAIKWTARGIQKELNLLREELNETKEGRKVVKALRKCYAEQKATLQPLRAEVGRDDITAVAKEAAEKNLWEKHLIFKKRFQDCFNRAVDLRIPIGHCIVDHYFDDLPDEEVKKSRWPFRLFGHLYQRSGNK